MIWRSVLTPLILLSLLDLIVTCQILYLLKLLNADHTSWKFLEGRLVLLGQKRRKKEKEKKI